MSKLNLISVLLGEALLLVAMTPAAKALDGKQQASAGSKGNKAASSSFSLESSSHPSEKPSTDKPAPPSSTPADPLAGLDMNAYRIGVDDELLISVWKEPDLSTVVAVRPDGMITLPLVNDIRVVGLSTKELQTFLSEKLKAFVNEPQVTITVRQIRSRRVYLIGSVGRQGPFPLSGNMTVLQLLSEAGGLGPFARSSKIHILRTVNGRQMRIPFNYKKAIQGQTGKNEDILLVPGDMVVVP